MTKFTDTQLVILSAAAQRYNLKILPLPTSLTTNKGAVTRVINGLIRKGLAAEVPATRDDEIWREDSDQRFAVVITDKGLDAIGVVDVEASPDADGVVRAEAASVQQASSSTNKTSLHRTGTKRAVVIGLLQRDGGASISDLMAKTGWQAHSVRGFISGTLKKKLGLTITSQAIEARGRVYSIVGQA